MRLRISSGHLEIGQMKITRRATSARDREDATMALPRNILLNPLALIAAVAISMWGETPLAAAEVASGVQNVHAELGGFHLAPYQEDNIRQTG
jgi:hypothetical protein